MRQTIREHRPNRQLLWGAHFSGTNRSLESRLLLGKTFGHVGLSSKTQSDLNRKETAPLCRYLIVPKRCAFENAETLRSLFRAPQNRCDTSAIFSDFFGRFFCDFSLTTCDLHCAIRKRSDFAAIASFWGAKVDRDTFSQALNKGSPSAIDCAYCSHAFSKSFFGMREQAMGFLKPGVSAQPQLEFSGRILKRQRKCGELSPLSKTSKGLTSERGVVAGETLQQSHHSVWAHLAMLFLFPGFSRQNHLKMLDFFVPSPFSRPNPSEMLDFHSCLAKPTPTMHLSCSMFPSLDAMTSAEVAGPSPSATSSRRTTKVLLPRLKTKPQK